MGNADETTPKHFQKKFEEAKGTEEVYQTCQDCQSISPLKFCTSCEPEETMPAVHELMREIPENDEGPAERSVDNRLMRVHRNLGHPSNRLLVHILKEAKAPESIIDVATKLECPICARHHRTAPARPANPLRARELGHTVAMDFSFHTTPQEKTGNFTFHR